jgi:hypothetical protein
VPSKSIQPCAGYHINAECHLLHRSRRTALDCSPTRFSSRTGALDLAAVVSRRPLLRDALGIPSFNQSNAVLNFDSDRQGFLRYGFEQVIEMNIEEATRSGQIDLSGLESDVLYPFDWHVCV